MAEKKRHLLGIRTTEEILAAEREEMEGSPDRLVQRGMISEEMVQQVSNTASHVSRGRRCYEATLEEVDLDPTEGVARMDVVVRGTIGTGSNIAYHVTGAARATISRCIYGNPEARTVAPEPEHVEQAEEEEVREEEEQVDEAAGVEGDMSRSEAQRLTRQGCLQFAGYQMFRRRAQQSRSTNARTMSRLGIKINAENEANNEIIQAQVGEQDQGDDATFPEDEEMNDALIDGGETEESWDPEGQQRRKPRRAMLFEQPEGPRTQRRQRIGDRG